MKKFLLLILLCFSSLGIFGQTDIGQLDAKPVGVEEVYLAKDDGKGAAGAAVEKFLTTDVPIYCVVLLDSLKPAVVKMNFVAVGVKGLKGETRIVSVSFTTDGNQSRVNFTGKPEGAWTEGNYRVDIFVDGKPAQSKSFVIEKSPALSPPVKSLPVKSLQGAPIQKVARRTRKN